MNFQFGMFFFRLDNERHGNDIAERGGESERDRSRQPTLRVRYILFQLIDCREDPTCVLQNLTSCIGERHSSSVPIKKPYPQFLFQQTDLAAQGRLRSAQYRSRLTEAS